MLMVEALFTIQVQLGKYLLLGMLAMSQYVYNMQWGTYNHVKQAQNVYSSIRYPISYTIATLAVVLTPFTEDMTDKINELDIATTCVRFDNNQQFSGRAYGHTGADTPMGFVWVSIGYQQWGVGAEYINKYSVTTLPIAFSNTNYMVLVTSSWLKSGAVMAGAALTTTQIKVWNGGYTDTYHFFAVGW